MENVLNKLKELLLEERILDIEKLNEQNRVTVITNHSFYFGDLSTIVFNMQDFLASFSDERKFESYVLRHKSNDEFINIVFTHGNYIDVKQKVKLLMLLVRYFSNDKGLNTQIYGFLRLDKRLINEFINNIKELSDGRFKYYDITFIAYLLNNLKFEPDITSSSNILREVHYQIERLFYYVLENLDIKTSITILDYTNELVIGNNGEKYGKVKEELIDAFAEKLYQGSDDNIIEFIKLLPIPRNAIVNFDNEKLVDDWVLRPFAADVYISTKIQKFNFLTAKSERAIQMTRIDEKKYLLEILNTIRRHSLVDKHIHEIRISDHKLTKGFINFLSENYKVQYSENLRKNDSTS